MDRLEVNAGSRLHFGLLCAPPESTWHYGGIGLMVDQPGWQFLISKSDADSVQASPAICERLQNVLETLRHSYEIPPVAIKAINEVAPHTGLGSGTQLALAVSSSLLVLSGSSRPSRSSELATLLNRNRRSGIGTFGFDKGGFIVDRGRNAFRGDALQRVSIPEDWRFVLLTPVENEGLSGSSEELFFGEQSFLQAETVLELEQLIQQQIVPALQHADFPQFAASIAEYGRIAGEYYSKAQGGIFSNPMLSEVVAVLEQQGITGAAQSSWGPTVCIPANNDSSAQTVVNAVASMDSANRIHLSVSKPLNTGASIRSVAPNGQRMFG